MNIPNKTHESPKSRLARLGKPKIPFRRYLHQRNYLILLGVLFLFLSVLTVGLLAGEAVIELFRHYTLGL